MRKNDLVEICFSECAQLQQLCDLENKAMIKQSEKRGKTRLEMKGNTKPDSTCQKTTKGKNNQKTRQDKTRAHETGQDNHKARQDQTRSDKTR
jgi:hypothetical protein